MRHQLVAVLATALAACTSNGKDPDDTDVGSTDAADSDTVDTDLLPADTDVVDTDAADTDIADTDTVPADTDTGDTDTVPADTDTGVLAPVDLDGDGVLSDVDCNDDDPTAFPGASNLCNGLDRSCGESEVDPVGTAALQDANGAWSDVTATLGAGSFATPTGFDVPVDSVLRVCGGTWAARLSAAAGATIEGVGRPVFDQGSPYTAVSGYGGDVVIRGLVVRGDNLDTSALLEVSQGTALVEEVELIGRVNGVAVTSGGALTLRNSSIHGQTGNALQLWGFGQALSATVEGCDIHNLGGTAFIGSASGPLNITDTTITDVAKGVQSGGSELTMTDVTLTRVAQPFDGSGTGDGHLLRVHATGSTGSSNWYAGSLDITDSSFKSGAQGLLVTTSGSLKLTEVTFSDLDATASWGGGLYVTGAGGGAVVKDCVFERNRAYYGGAVFASVPVEFVGAQFLENSAYAGGAVYLSSDADGTTFDGITATSNSASSSGGAIYTEAGVTVTSSNLSGNTSGTGGGGAISANGTGHTPAVLTTNTFSTNSTQGSGGAAYAVSLQSSGNTYDGNAASGNGGALYVVGARDEDLISDDTFVSNGANGAGGAIAWDHGITVTDALFGTFGLANTPTSGAWTVGPVSLGLVDGSFVCENSLCL